MGLDPTIVFNPELGLMNCMKADQHNVRNILESPSDIGIYNH